MQDGLASLGLKLDRRRARKSFKSFSIILVGEEFFPLLMSEVSSHSTLGLFGKVFDG